MTGAATAAPSTVTEGAVPPPPPDVVEESRTIEPVPFARQLWDRVTLHDGLTLTDLRAQARFPLGETTREYVRWHHGTHPPTMKDADDDYFDRAMQQGIERGWLIVTRGKVTAGDCPPEHTPMNTLGKERTLRAMLHGMDERRAFNLLIDPKSAARHLVTPNKPRLRKSLKTVGQMYPILRWQPFGNQPIIIDGVTRLELLHDLGLADDEIDFRDLGDMTALEALQLRIELEVASTAKELDGVNGREAYIAKLKDEGFTQEAIGRLVGLSRQRVGEILSLMPDDQQRRQVTENDVAEFNRLRDGGWDLRAIGESTGWSKDTVQRYLNETRTPAPVTPAGTKNPKQPKVPAQSKRSTPEAAAAAKRHGLSPESVKHRGPKVTVATLDAHADHRAALMEDPSAIKTADEFLAHPVWRQYLIDKLVEAGEVVRP